MKCLQCRLSDGPRAMASLGSSDGVMLLLLFDPLKTVERHPSERSAI